MVKRTRVVQNARPWPSHWQVLHEWDIPASIKLPRRTERHLVSREFEIALKGAPSQWLLFDKYVYNPANDKEWVDAFTQGNFAAYTAFRPERIIKVRARVVSRRPKKPTETVDTQGAT